MRKTAPSIVLLSLAGVALSGCGPHLKKLGVCSAGAYRYANPNGVSLPSLSVPTPEDLADPRPSSSDPAADAKPTSPPPPSPSTNPPGATQPPAAPAGNPAPVATPPKVGAMLLPHASTSFRSC